MKVVPAAAPNPSKGEYTPNTSSAADQARARAIAMLTNSAPQSQASPTPPEVAVAQAKANVSEEHTPESAPNSGLSSTDEEPSPQSTEPPKAETPVAVKAEEPISSQFAVLARKEKQYRAKVQAQEAALKAKEAAIAQREAALAAKDAEYTSGYVPKSKLSEDPITTLLEAGVSYDKITEMVLQQQSSTLDPQTKVLISQMQAEIKALKGETENTKKTITQNQEESYKQALQNIRQNVSSLVKDGTDYEAIRETNSVEDVVELIERTFKEDGVLLTEEEAASQVEQELVERISKYSRLSKIQQKNQPSNTKAAPQNTGVQQQSQGKQQQPAKTLTNNLSGTRQLTARERALLAFEGKLGK